MFAEKELEASSHMGAEAMLCRVEALMAFNIGE